MFDCKLRHIQRKIMMTTESKITILFLASDPNDASRLRLGEEQREIYEKLRLANMRDKFSFEVRTSV